MMKGKDANKREYSRLNGNKEYFDQMFSVFSNFLKGLLLIRFTFGLGFILKESWSMSKRFREIEMKKKENLDHFNSVQTRFEVVIEMKHCIVFHLKCNQITSKKTIVN